ncbi:GAF domain-containing protein [candidate division KSB1 bacterium]|nr:GAF domain-containing protein [candidate division KSB1 bacterium]
MIHNKTEAYRWAAARVRAQTVRHVDLVATLANTAAILKEYLPNFFWVGFYFFCSDHLLLGPFQGPPACVRLSLDKGVCAAAVREKRTILVDNVHDFVGHVACDARSKSEIVVPIFDRRKALKAVLDVDSETVADFDRDDEIGLQQIVQLLQDIWQPSIASLTGSQIRK